FINLTDTFFSLFLSGFKNNEETTGTYVRQKSIAPISAKLKVNAIGLNILPSTPLNDKIGMNTIKIMSCPNMAEFIILEALLSVMESIWVCCSALVASFIFEVCAVILKA